MAPSPVSTQDCIDMLGRLVAYDTTSALSNLALIEDVREQLAALGVEVRLTHNTAGDKANLWATIGPADRGALGPTQRIHLVLAEPQLQLQAEHLLGSRSEHVLVAAVALLRVVTLRLQPHLLR